MKERNGQFYTGRENTSDWSFRKQVQNACAILAFIVILLMAAGFVSSAYGQEAEVSLSGGGTYEKGDIVTLTVKYTGGTFGSATGRITYDSDILTYKSCSGAEAHGNGGTVVFNVSDGTGGKSLQCKLKFKAAAAGKSTVKLNTSDIYNIDLTEMSAADKTTSVSIKNTSKSASSNANLAALKVSEGQLSPAFSKDVTAYTVKVGKNVEQCSITAVKEDGKAKLSVSGSGKLSIGDNVRKITVTAESGKTKTYVITINRAAKDGKQDRDADGAGSDSAGSNADSISGAADDLLLAGDDANAEQPDADAQTDGNSAVRSDKATVYLLIALGITIAALLVTVIALQIRILKSSVKRDSGIERKERRKKT